MGQKEYEIEIGGQKLIVELTDLTEQANGSCLVRYGDTLVLATAVMSEHPKEGMNYFPLVIDYEEKYYAAGRIRGSRFVRRETRPSDEAILVGRMIDRTLRPKFNQKTRNEVQVVITVLSIDDKNDPDIPSMLAASCAIMTSNIPWNGPIAGVRVGKAEGKFVINPTYEQRENGALDLVVAGTEEKINMMEGGGEEIPEKELVEAIEFAKPYIKELIDFQKKIYQDVKPEKAAVETFESDEEFVKEIRDFLAGRVEEALYENLEKKERMEGVNKLADELKFYIEGKYKEDLTKIQEADYIFEEIINRTVHEKILKEEKRSDGRKVDEVRPLNCEVGILPRTHGSGIFARGSTKALSVLTLGAPGDEQLIEGMEIVGKKRFMHHYNFPPYCVGEVRMMRGPGRREIGHGALAERALKSLIPPKEDFPYTIRLVSEILSSNGSSSMASVCAASLALMDGGVPIKEPVAGIAMGLMVEEGNYKVLTDIQGPEDHHGDMDLKIAGTRNGVTGLQMDVKVEGVTVKILEDTFENARKARLEILEAIKKTIEKPREELSSFAPRIFTLQINPEKIRDVIGPGGKVINEIIRETEAAIDIEDSGLVFVTSPNEESAKKAISWIKNLTREVKIGEIFQGKVKKITDFGAFVEILPGQEGLAHISELAPRRIEKVEDVLRLGDVKPFKVIGIDPQGKISLSLKAATMDTNSH